MIKELDKTMKKKGIAELVGSILIIGVLVIGYITSYTVISENRYVGDKTTFKVYDLKSCNIDLVSKESRISFNNLKEAEESGYSLNKCK